jgi:hypothetical protein
MSASSAAAAPSPPPPQSARLPLVPSPSLPHRRHHACPTKKFALALTFKSKNIEFFAEDKDAADRFMSSPAPGADRIPVGQRGGRAQARPAEPQP